jgi:transcriptional regulator with XRE-family HTH domain
MLKMSQEELGDGLGLTFQQVQKYEKGTNRISASRLQQLSIILQVPVPFFFEGIQTGGGKNAKASPPDYVSDFLTTADGLALTGAFMLIPLPAVRRSIVRLVEEIASRYL